MCTLGWAFVERQTNLWKRHWAWELVWLVYGVVNTLADHVHRASSSPTRASCRATRRTTLVLFLLIGTLVWAYLSAVLDDISLVITWERWEGTIEHTLMAPVPRVAHLLGTAVFGVLHAIVRTTADHGRSRCRSSTSTSAQADWPTVVVVMLVGSAVADRARHPRRRAAAALPGARRADVVHGAGVGAAGVWRVLLGRGAARRGCRPCRGCRPRRTCWKGCAPRSSTVRAWPT